MITLRKLNKTFGRLPAVVDFDLEVKEGEIFGLLGHNGAGKSTIIGMMLGQVWPDSGEVLIFGYNVIKQRQLALEKVGAIFETPVFYDYLSGWRNLEILSHYTAPTPASRIKEVIDWVGLSGREHSKVSTYSHGMRARLALAQALLPNPKLLILDEPGDGLDPEGIHELRLTILKLHKEMGITIFLSSHLLNEVEQLCSRVAVIKQGKKIFDGTLDEIKRRQKWIRLKTSDFEDSVRCLMEAKMISSYKNPFLISPADGVLPSNIVRFLISKGFDIEEITPVEETLEDFYLSLMGAAKT